MKHLDSFEKQVYDRTINKTDILKEKLTNDNFAEVEDYMADEFIKMFEDLFVNQLMYDLIEEGFFKDKFNQAKDWVNNKTKDAGEVVDGVKQSVKQGVQQTKQAVKKGVNVVGDAMKGFKDAIIKIFNKIKEGLKNISFSKMLDKAKASFKKMKKALFGQIAATLEVLRLPLIEKGWVSEDNKFKTSVAFKQIMIWTKEDKKLSGDVDISKSQKEFGILNDKMGDITMETVTYKNESMGIILEGDETIKTFEPKDQVKSGEKFESGTKLTEESLKTGGYGFFKRILFHMGIKEAKANSIVSMIIKSAIISGIIALLLGPIMGLFGISIGGAIAGATAGATALSATSAAVLLMIGGILIALGLFMVITWIIKPYPNVNDLKAYLKAWFHAYPDGIPHDDETECEAKIRKRMARIKNKKAMKWELIKWLDDKCINDDLRTAIIELLKKRKRVNGGDPFSVDDPDELRKEGEIQKEYVVKRAKDKKKLNPNIKPKPRPKRKLKSQREYVEVAGKNGIAPGTKKITK